MNVNREQFLNDLQMVRAGLSPREFVEQSSCFVFRDGEVMTFNDEVACRKKVDAKITGAVQSGAILDILQKLDDTELDVSENVKGELEFAGKRKRFGLTKEAEIFLPVDRVERPEKWSKLPKEFIEAVGMVQHCVSTDESKFVLTCIHITPLHVEACDNFQMIRHESKLPIKESVMVRGASLKDITGLAMNEVAVTKSWMHFRNASGLVFSCRRYADEFPDLEPMLKKDKDHAIVIPKGMAKASDRAAVFAVDATGESQVQVTLADGRIRIRGEGAIGWYRESTKVHYDGPPMSFFISPILLKQVSENHSDAAISENKLAIGGGPWRYVTCLSSTKRTVEDAEEEKPKKKKEKNND